MKSKMLAMLALSALVGCSSNGTTSGSGSGGSQGKGGSTGTGGSSSSGGAPGSGDASTGGAGGSTGAGGSSSPGGASGKGGSGGGATANGGASGSGGAQGGGGLGSGGTRASGGAQGSGGASASGGAQGNGGASASGGSAGTGGSSSTSSASGYPAPGSGGVSKPSGTVGNLTVLPWAGFKGAVSFTFDDANQTQIDHYSALQALNDKGNNVHYTFYLITGKSTMSSSVWKQAVKDGHELGNHTKSHAQSGDEATLASDTDAATTFIESTFGVTPYTMAAPYGTSTYATVAKTRFLANRSASDFGAIAPTDNPDTVISGTTEAHRYNLPCHIPATSASASDMESPISTAVGAGKWEVMLVHGFSGGSDGAYQPVDIDQFTATVSWAKSQGNMWIGSVVDVASYWIAGYFFAKLTPTTSGGTTTWTWKTSDFSDHFPPGKYLRVTVDGGTLKQGGTTLTWDDHGYYEVSLDAGTLTLSP